LIALFLMPVGLAVANYADTGSAPRKQQVGQVLELVAQGKGVLDTVVKTRAQLAADVAAARRSNDRLLSTCLESALHELDKLSAKASSRWALLAASQAESSARLSFVVITVIGQKVNLVVQQASRCVGAEQREPELAEIAGPTDPNASSSQAGDTLDPTLLPQTLGLPSVPPPPVTTGTSPSTGDEPIDMGVPSMPTAASPVM
jgi:hypothetical protein